MTALWESETIGELCSVVNGGTPKTGVKAYWDGPHQWITPAEMGKRATPYIGETERTITDEGLRNSSAQLLPPHSVILSSRAPIGHLVINTEPMATNQGCKGLVPGSKVDHKFLYYYLGSIIDLLNDLGTGATFKELSGGKLKEVRVPVPSISEQQRIVAILDEAFEGIATAKVNAKKNLQNARAVFESYLQDSYCARVGHLPRKRLEGLCEMDRLITYGVIKLGDPVEDGIPCLRTSNVRWLDIDITGMKRIAPTLAAEYSRTILRGGEVLVNVRGTLGGVAVVPNDMAGWNVSREVAVIPVNQDILDPQYAAFWIGSRTSQDWLSGVKKGAAYTGINIEDLRNLPVPLPALTAQRAIVEDILTFRDAALRMANIYERKLAALEELKKSLLHQAFSGQLTSSKQGSITQLLALQTTTPEFSANVISLAYARHERQKREKTFGHVKEQKLLHLVESIAGIDLGRQPMRDAAGPNDFQHMLRADNWAKANGYFDMVNRGEGYEFRKLSSFDEHASRARQVLAPYLSRLEPVIDLLVPMDTEEAEVFATVHAAWNNLLIEGVRVTDDAIVLAARQEWHPDKLKIPEHKFRSAIEKIRQKKLIPDGSAKYVGGQKALFDQSVLPAQQR